VDRILEEEERLSDLPSARRSRRHRSPAIWLTAISAGMLLLAASAASAAVVFTVNSTSDGVDDNPGNGVCHTVDGTCTLRAAVMEANRAPNAGATIVLPASADPYLLQIFPAGADGEENGDLNLTTPVSGNPVIVITGSGASSTVIDANGIDRVLYIAAGRTAVISGLTVRNGTAAGVKYTESSDGGAIFNAGALTLVDCMVSDSSASYEGGGIFNDYGAVLQIGGCTVEGNDAAVEGGGIYTEGTTVVGTTAITDNTSGATAGGIFIYAGTTSIDRSTISGNTATDSLGGGIFVDDTANITNSTISGNFARHGGGIYNEGALFISDTTISQNHSHRDGGGIYTIGNALFATNVYNSTIAFNQADDDSNSVGTGGGVYAESGGAFNMRNTVLAGNFLGATHDPSDCAGSIGIYGNNRRESASGCSIAVGSPGSVFAVDSIAELSPLRDHGGATRTHALVPPSNLIDGAAACIDQNSAPLPTDQRGRARNVGPSCDIGAFEYDPGDIFANGFQ